MPALHPTNVWNVQTTLNQWLVSKAATITLPITINYTWEFLWPEKPIAPPVISVFHADIGRDQAWLGSNAGGEIGVDAASLADISIWIARNPNWGKQMSLLRSVLEAIFANSATIPIKDYRASTSAPSDTAYVLKTRSYEMGEVMQDSVNPDLMRTRSLLRYEWALRTNVV